MDKIIIDQKELRQVSRETTWEEVKQLNLRERLEEAMKTSWVAGVGLAAIQIGVPLRYAWYKIPKPNGGFIETELINPRIISAQKLFFYSREGCLSIPHHWAQTKRYRMLEVENGNQKYIAENLEAIVIQHELDHMNGVLTIDIEVDRFGNLGRNEPCGCGSGKKYKRCCLR